MDKPSTTSLLRTKSDQLVEAISAAMGGGTKSSPMNGEESGGGGVGSDTLSRKSSRRLTSPSPGRSVGRNNTHIRKSRSAQLKFDLDEVTSGAALSRASSASLGLSFSFTGFAIPSDDIGDMKPYSDDDIRKYLIIQLLSYVISAI